MKVSEVMTSKPVCCAMSHSAMTAALLMQEHNTAILLVTHDAFTHKLAGVVTDRDLCVHVIAADRDPAHVWVHECMAEDPICCTEGDEVGRALELMTQYHVRRLPVVDQQHEIVGILSLTDLVRKGAISPDELFAVLQKISAPRGTPASTRFMVVA